MSNDSVKPMWQESLILTNLQRIITWSCRFLTFKELALSVHSTTLLHWFCIIIFLTAAFLELPVPTQKQTDPVRDKLVKIF